MKNMKKKKSTETFHLSGESRDASSGEIVFTIKFALLGIDFSFSISLSFSLCFKTLTEHTFDMFQFALYLMTLFLSCDNL